MIEPMCFGMLIAAIKLQAILFDQRDCYRGLAGIRPTANPEDVSEGLSQFGITHCSISTRVVIESRPLSAIFVCNITSKVE
jgi:hypothetical protein